MTDSIRKMFAMIYGICYFTVFYMEWATVRYYPVTSQFRIDLQPTMGPPILWYGWLGIAAVMALVVSALVPRRVVDRIPNDAVWIVNVVVLMVILIYERQWFI